MQGEKCKIAFKNPDKTNYGYGFITKNLERHVEKCYDSTRFYAINLLNEKNQALLMGIGFDDRNVAFDFMQALLKFKKNVEYDTKAVETVAPVSKEDFTLKEGEKLVLNFGGAGGAPVQPSQ